MQQLERELDEARKTIAELTEKLKLFQPAPDFSGLFD